MKFKAVFISDTHLGTKDSKASLLLEFIKEIETKELYLVGDIIDGWSLKRKWIWLQPHSDVIQKILKAARKGVRVTYILGNHDEFIRPFLPLALGDHIRVVDEATYKAKNKKRYTIVHGDLYDSITMTKKWLAILGDNGYQFLLRLNDPINTLRQRLGFRRYWSFSQFIKDHVKQAVAYISDFEKILVAHAREEKFDGIICGHIHKAEIRDIEGITYMNCGDWVESCTALVETLEGEFKIIRWLDER